MFWDLHSALSLNTAHLRQVTLRRTHCHFFKACAHGQVVGRLSTTYRLPDSSLCNLYFVLKCWERLLGHFGRNVCKSNISFLQDRQTCNRRTERHTYTTYIIDNQDDCTHAVYEEYNLGDCWRPPVTGERNKSQRRERQVHCVCVCPFRVTRTRFGRKSDTRSPLTAWALQWRVAT